MNNKSTSFINVFVGALLIMGARLAGCETHVSQKMPWEDPCYAKDVSATRAADLAANFPSPPHSAKTGVFWFWVNGNITREGITADLEAMARVGIGRVVIFEVSGDIPGGTVKFLSDEWRALFRHALAEANRLDVKLNINNDAGWCGSGGPWNTPENSMQQLVSTRTSVEGGKSFDAVLPQPPAVKGFYRDILVLATKAVPAGNDPKRIWPRSQAVDLTSRTDASGRLRWDPPAGTWDILRIGHTSTGKDNHPAPESGCGPECDKLSKAAVKAHFDGMMAKLITDAGPLAGKTLEYTHIDSWEVGTQNWTPAFRAEFRRLRGYDPLPFLPGELGYIVDDAETNRRFQWDMRVTVSDLMLENYAGYFRELAAAHGLKLSVEAYGAHPGQCPVNNLSYAGRSDIPTGEFWLGLDYRSCKEMASASHVYGKRLTGAEAFTTWPDNARFQFHPGNIKVMGDQSFCAGVNRLMLHCYPHQPWLDRAPGMTMQGWGTHFSRNQTWWEQSKAWHTYIARCQHLLQNGLFAADVCYLDVEDAPRDAPYPLGLAGYDYDVCPAEVVKNRMNVKDGRITLPDGMSYRLLVLPPSEAMTPETLRRIVDLAKAGAVIAATKIPCRSPSLQNYPACDAEIKALAGELFGDQAAVPATSVREMKCGAGRVFLGGELAQVLAALGVPSDVSIAGGGKDKRFSWIHRRTADAEFYFIVNQFAREEEITCTFRVTGSQPELWHPETGTISALPVCQATADGRVEVPLKFGPEEAFFVVFRKDGRKVTVEGARKPGRNWREFTPAQTIDGAWKVTFEPKWGGPEKPVVFETLADWSSNATEGIKFYSGTAVYQKTFAVDLAVAGLPSVVLDLGQVEVMADVKLNGKDLGTLWKKPFRIDVTGHLKPGDNQLEIRVVNLWCNRLIGDQQLPEDAEWKNGFMGWGGQFQILKSWPQWLKDGKPSPGGRFTFSTASYYKKDDALKPSGLMGPVRLVKAE